MDRINHLSNYVSVIETEFVISKLLTKKTGPNGFTNELYQTRNKK